MRGERGPPGTQGSNGPLVSLNSLYTLFMSPKCALVITEE